MWKLHLLCRDVRWKMITFCGYFYLISMVSAIHKSHESSKLLALATASQGHVVGEVVKEAGIFWGIPFSQPPVGEYRWKNPRNPTSYKEKYWNATFKRPGCVQICHNRHANYSCPPTTSEDCLFLNVFVPRRILTSSSSTKVLGKKHYAVASKYTKEDKHSLAVMVFLHGGNFIIGAGSAVLYDGRFMSHRGDVVMVTINYRLGPLGFLVQGNGLDAAKGNYGMLDQIKALEWVRMNIKHFGGNPKKVTLFGQSAGAESIGILMTSPLQNGLFHKAIFESDPISLPYRTISQAKKFGSTFVRRLGCTPGNMTCMRKIDANEIAVAANRTKVSLFTTAQALNAFQQWGPVIDGKLMLKHPIQAFRKGEFHRMPVIMGDNVNDAYLFIDAAFRNEIPSFLYDIILKFITHGKSDIILQQYPQCPSFFCDNKKILSKLATDYVFVCAARNVLFSMGPRSWFYIFNSTIPHKGIWRTKFCNTGVCHGADLPYVFSSVSLSPYHFKDGQEELSFKMEYYWSNFAKHGDPNGRRTKARKNFSKAEYWGRFLNFRDDAYKTVDLTSRGNFMISNFHKRKCDFWDKLNLYGKL